MIELLVIQMLFKITLKNSKEYINLYQNNYLKILTSQSKIGFHIQKMKSCLGRKNLHKGTLPWFRSIK